MMQTCARASLSTNGHFDTASTAWNSNSSVYGHRSYHGNQQHHQQQPQQISRPYVDRQLSYCGSRQDGAVPSVRQYLIVPSSSYSSADVDAPAGSRVPRHDDLTRRPYQLPLNADLPHQPDNMPAAAAGSYASTGTGNAYGSGGVNTRQLPDVVGGHVTGWINHGVYTAQDSSHLAQGPLLVLFRLRLRRECFKIIEILIVHLLINGGHSRQSEENPFYSTHVTTLFFFYTNFLQR